MPSETPAGHADLRRTLVRNTSWNYVGFAVNLAVSFALFPFVVARVGDSAAGVWLLLGSVTGYMGLMELGLVPALTQHVAAALGRGTTREVERAASTALALLAGLMLVALQCLWLVPFLVGVLQIPQELRADAARIFGVAIAGFALRMPLAAYQAILLGCQRQDRSSQLWVLLATVKAVATVVLLTAGFDILAVVVMEAVAHLLAGGLQILWVRQELPWLRLSWRDVDRRYALQLVTFGGVLLLTSVCSLVIEQTDRLVVGAFLPIAQVTHFSAAAKLYMLAFAVPTTLVQAVAPLAGLLFGRGDTAGLRILFTRMTKYTAATALVLVVSLGFASGAILRIWMGPRFVDAHHVMQALGLGLLVTSFNHAGYSALMGTRRIGPLLWRYFVPQAVLNLGLSLWLVVPFGTVGVAMGTAIPALLLQGPFLAYLLRQLDVRWRDFAIGTVLPVVAPAIVAFSPLAVAYWLLPADSMALVGAASLCAAVYAGLFWTFSLDAAERADFVRIVARRGGTSVAPLA